MLLNVPPTFAFRRTVLSHGWCVLAPFSLDRTTWTLRYAGLTVCDGDAGTVRIGGSRRARDRDLVAHLLHLDGDLDGFYELCMRRPRRGEPDLRWVPAAGAGRMLRCPTPYEDLIKLVCTTNCSWALTEKMVGGLVGAFGDGTAFPDAATIADAGPEALRELSFGYRAGSVATLCRMIADGDVDPGRWLDPELDPATFRREVLALPGCGPYVADNLGKLVGHADGLGLDSWVRAKLRRLCADDTLDDASIAQRYARFGRWRGLAVWCDVTADWLDADNDKINWD